MRHNDTEKTKKQKLTDEQIKNLEEDGLFDDLELVKCRLATEVYNDDSLD